MAKLLVRVAIFTAGTVAGVIGKAFYPKIFHGKKHKKATKKEDA